MFDILVGTAAAVFLGGVAISLFVIVLLFWMNQDPKEEREAARDAASKACSDAIGNSIKAAMAAKTSSSSVG